MGLSTSTTERHQYLLHCAWISLTKRWSGLVGAGAGSASVALAVTNSWLDTLLLGGLGLLLAAAYVVRGSWHRHRFDL